MASGSTKRRSESPADWVGASGVLIVVGKGGVGSSTVAAAVAILAARGGRDVLLVSVDAKPGLGPLFGSDPLTAGEQTLRSDPSGGRVRGRTITPQDAFRDYLDLRGVGAVMRRAVQALSLDLLAASTPGLEHLMVLAKIKELERTSGADLIVVDAPPAGHAAAFVGSAHATRAAVGPGPLRTQADEVHEMLSDGARTRAMIVTLAEETPVNEAVELSHDLYDTLGLASAPLVVNGCWPDRSGLDVATATAARTVGLELTASQRSALVASRRFGAARLEVQQEQLDRIDEALPLTRILIPRLPSARLDPDDLDLLADALSAAQSEPRPSRSIVAPALLSSQTADTTVDGSLSELISTSSMIVTCGPGGVGKTTAAAAIGLLGARAGRKVVVVTIDPARRLADALGLTEGDIDDPHRVRGLGRLKGTLDVLMLDAEQTFDRLITARAGERAEAILQNPIYRSIAGSLAGAQDYMAIERLHQLHDAGQHDLIVIDTPPSRHAVDILSAPDRLATFVGHPVYRMLTGPSRTFNRMTSPATAAFAWTVRRLAGPQIVSDTIDFFRSLAGIEDGLTTRAVAVSELLRDPGTSFVLVSSPRSEAIDEATELSRELGKRRYRLRAVVANLVHPLPPVCDLDDTLVASGTALADQLVYHRELTALAIAERDELAVLWDVISEFGDEAVASAVVRCAVPLLDHDVHALDALAEIANVLSG